MSNVQILSIIAVCMVFIIPGIIVFIVMRAKDKAKVLKLKLQMESEYANEMEQLQRQKAGLITYASDLKAKDAALMDINKENVEIKKDVEAESKNVEYKKKELEMLLFSIKNSSYLNVDQLKKINSFAAKLLDIENRYALMQEDDDMDPNDYNEIIKIINGSATAINMIETSFYNNFGMTSEQWMNRKSFQQVKGGRQLPLN